MLQKIYIYSQKKHLRYEKLPNQKLKLKVEVDKKRKRWKKRQSYLINEYSITGKPMESKFK